MSALLEAIWEGPFPAEVGSQTILPGGEALVTEDDLKSSHWRAKAGQKSETRDELNARAREAGVTDPESLPNKAAVEQAIADATPGSES